MGEPLRTAARLLAEVPPFLQFLRTVHDSDLPNHGMGQGFDAPDPTFWRAAADDVLRELRADPPPQDAEAKKVCLRRLLQRAQTGRHAAQQLSAGDGRLELPLAACNVGSRSLPAGVVEAIAGLFLADASDEDVMRCSHGTGTSWADLGCRVGVDDNIVLPSSIAECGDGELWRVFLLFADRLVLLFDQGKTVLVAGSRTVLTSFVYGILLRCWQFSADDAARYLQRIGRNLGDVGDAFRRRASELPSVHRLPCSPGERPTPVALALRAHVRLIDESRQWPLQRAEPLVRTTEALLARALSWEPRTHDAASPGIVCLAMLRAVRLELAGVANKRYCAAFRDLVSVVWRVGGRTTLEDGLVIEPDVAAGPDKPAALAEELEQELQNAVQLPTVLMVAVEGTRPVILSETVSVSRPALDHAPQQKTSYCTYALLLGRDMVTRAPAASIPAVPGSSATAGGELLVPQPPILVVLVHERLVPCGTWTPWSSVLSGCTQLSEVPRSLSEKNFELRLVTIAQYECAKRSGRRSAWDEVDILGVSELPVDARAALLQRRLASRLQIPVAWQLLLAPGEHGWRYLLPSARIMDYAVAPAGVAGPRVLVLSVLKETTMVHRNSKTAVEQDASAFLCFPWMPVICQAWVERQLIPLDVVLFDGRRSLASYTARIARRLEEEAGPHAYYTAFAAYELLPHASGAAQGQQGWRALQVSAPLATELRVAATDDGGSLPAPWLVWEAIPLAPSMTGRGLFAAHDVACLPDLCAPEKRLPLERLTVRKTEELGAALLQGPWAEAPRASEAEDYAALLVLEERLLVAWVEDCAEAVGTLAAEARRRIDAMVLRLRAAAPEEPPPGLREWPPEPAAQWPGRTWERICRGAAQLQGCAMPAPQATEAEVARSLLWAEVSTLQEIVLSLDAICLNRQSRVTLDGVRAGPRASGAARDVVLTMHLGARLGDVAEAERAHYTVLLQSDELNELFSREVEDLPSECDSDVAGLHALVQTTNAELNAVWVSQRSAVLAGEDKQLWRVVRLRELALAAPFLLVKQTQGTKVVDGLALEWLQQVQQGCHLVLQKSQILCEAASAVVGPPAGGEEAIAAALEELVRSLEVAAASLEELHCSASSEGTGACDAAAEEAERVLNTCDLHTLSGNLLALALERQLEASAVPASHRIAKGMRAVREGLHRLTPKAMLVRACFDLPLVEDTVATFASESQRRGRKLRLLGRNSRRPPAGPANRLEPSHGSKEEADPAGREAAAAAAEAQAMALLRSEDQARVKKDSKKSRQRTKKQGQSAVPCAQAELRAAGASTASVSARDCSGSAKEKSGRHEGIGEKLDSGGADARHCEKIVVGRPLGGPLEPEEEAAPDGDTKLEDKQEVKERLLLERGPFELLAERRKARLLEIGAASGARCTLDRLERSVQLSGSAAAVAAAHKLVAELCVEWVQVAEPVWTVLLQGRDSPGGHLSRLQKEARCRVVVDRASARVRVAGTLAQVEAAQSWLWRLHEDCDCVQLWLGPHVDAPEALAAEAEAGSPSVRVDVQRQCCGGYSARVQGLTREVLRAVETVRAAALQSPTLTGSTAAADGLSEESGGSSNSAGSNLGRAGQGPLPGVAAGCGYDSGARTPSDWGDGGEAPAQERLLWERDVNEEDATALMPAPFVPACACSPTRTGEASFATLLPHHEERARAEDDGAMSLAERLAQEFPSARIIIGAPDEQQQRLSRRGEPCSAGRLELQMKRLKQLLEQDKARPLLL